MCTVEVQLSDVQCCSAALHGVHVVCVHFPQAYSKLAFESALEGGAAGFHWELSDLHLKSDKHIMKVL